MSEYDHIVLGISIFTFIYNIFLNRYMDLPEEKEYWNKKMGIRKIGK